MITHDQIIAIDRFADDLYKAFPIPQHTNDFTEELKKIYYQHAWDVITLLKQSYQKEFDLYVKEMAQYYKK